MLTLRANQSTRLTAPSQLATTTAAVAAVGLAAAHAGVDAVSGSIAVLVPTIEQRFSLSGGGIAALLAVLSASSMLAQPLVGRVADRVGVKRVAVGGALLAAPLLSLLGVVGQVWMLYAAVLLGGLGSAAFHPAAAALARQAVPSKPSLGVSLFSAGGMLGLALGPVLLVAVIAAGGVRLTPLVMVPGVVLSVVLWRVLPDARVSAEKRRRSVGALHLARGPVGRVALAGTLLAVGVTTFHVGLPLWITQEHRLATDSPVIGWALGAFDLAAAVGGLAAAALSTRVAPARVAVVALGVAPVAFAGALLTRPGSALFFLACVVAGAAANAAAPLLFVAAQDRSNGAVAAASGLMGFATGVAGVAFIGVGALSDVAGLAVGLSVGFAAVVPAAAIAIRCLDRRPVSSTINEALAAAACACHVCACPAAGDGQGACLMSTP